MAHEGELHTTVHVFEMTDRAGREKAAAMKETLRIEYDSLLHAKC